MLMEHDGRKPTVHESAYVAPTAVICGDVTLGEACRVLFGAVVVAEGGRVVLGSHCVVMENAVIRGSRRHPVSIGNHVLVGPHAYLSGCTLEDDVFLATGATVFNGARICSRAEVRINGVVHLETTIPADAVVPIGWVAVGDPAEILPPGEHERIWAIQEPLDFPRTVFGISRPATGESLMPELTRRYSKALRKHLDDQPMGRPAEPGSYSTVDEEVVQDLIAIVGDDNVLLDSERLEPYSHDETVGLRGDPEVAVRVSSAEQVAEIFSLANRAHVPVTPRGAGYGLSGGAVPTGGGIVLTLERMNKIIEIDRANLMATVEPGVITGDLHRAVEAEGLFYPPDPASLDSCSMGGNIAEGAGGPRAVKYGTTKDYVCGLEAVLPSGKVVQMGGKLVKNVTGYNLVQLLIGSEGTLAVVTKITVRLLPLPKHQVDLLVPFRSIDAAASVVSAIIERRVVPAALELMERDVVLACQRLLDNELPFASAAAQLLVKLDGNHRPALDEECEIVGAVCSEAGASDILVASDRPTSDRLWQARRSVIDALNHECPVNHMEDLVVPRAAIPTLIHGTHDLADKLGVRILSFGHAGDGNIHTTALKDDLNDDEWRALVPRITESLYRLTLSLGGTLTGEHGIGAIRRRYLPLALEEAQIDVMRRLRAAFDPNAILNPYKIFP